MKKKVYAYLHTHWDMEWYRDKEDFDIRLVDVVDGVLEELENNNAPCFYFDGQIVALLNYLKIKPENKSRIIQLINQKKLFIGPFFVSADTYLTNFVSMIKNLEIGLKYSKEFNQKDFIGYICDVFGISNSIFEALKLKNIKQAVIWRGVNPKKIKNNCNFIKNDINTLWLSQGYFNDFLHTNPINISGLKKYLDKISLYSKDALLLPIGADHLGILKDAKNKIKQINKELDDYEIILTSPFEYFKNTKFENITKENEFLDNSDTYILGGVYSSRIPQKIKNSYLQNKISRIIEPLNFFLKEKYSKNIEIAYETLLKNHAHDGICGCSLDSVANNVDNRFLKCENILNSIEKNIIQNFKKHYSKTNISKNSIGLFNFSNFDNIKTVEIKLPYILKNSQVLDYEEKFLDEHLADIYKIPVTEEITKIYRQLIEISNNKKMSFSSVDVLKPKTKIKISDNFIENNNIKLEIKNKKVFITDKIKNEKTELLLTDIKEKGDSYNSAPFGEYKIFNLLSSKILYKGTIQSALELKYENIKLKVSLNNNSEFLNLSAEINNKIKNHKIQAVFKTSKNILNTVSQDALGVTKRKIDCNYDIRKFMPAKRPTELKTNSYPMQNFVAANKVCALTKGLNEYEIFKNEIRICLLRTFDTISNPKNPARAIPAGPNLKTPDAELLGKNKAEFAITFGDYKKAFKNLDEFLKNYITVDGEYEYNREFLTFERGDVFYGISENKKIVYNLNNKKIRLI